MRVFYGFLLLIAALILFILPISEAVYDFRTNLQEDNLASTTGVGETSDNITLSEAIYDDDTTTVSVLSSLSTDAPVLGAYGASSHTVNITGLTANTTRTLTISYDIDSLPSWSAVGTLTGYLQLIWYLVIIVFLVGAGFIVFRR